MRTNPYLDLETKNSDEGMDIFAGMIALVSLVAAIFLVTIALWTIYFTPVQACGAGFC